MRISWPSAARYANSCHTPGNTRKDPLFSLFAVANARTFDQDYRVTDIEISGSGMLHDLSYGYNVVDNITSLTDGLNASLSQTFDYDVLDRLSDADGDYGDQSYTYDANGNRTGRDNATTLVTQTLTYTTGTNQLATEDSQTVVHDGAGNRTSDDGGTRAYAYNHAGRLTQFTDSSVVQADYTYNAQGQRVKKVRHVGASDYVRHFFYDQAGQLIGEYRDNPDGTYAYVDYIWLNGAPLVQEEHSYNSSDVLTGTQTTWLHVDHLNTPRVGTDDTQTIVWRWDSDPFGVGSADSDADNDTTDHIVRLRFPGQYQDEESGHYYNYFRDFDPATGRYLESDPIGLDGGMNRYAYVESDPMRGFDDKGLRPESHGDCQGIGCSINNTPIGPRRLGATAGVSGTGGTMTSSADFWNDPNGTQSVSLVPDVGGGVYVCLVDRKYDDCPDDSFTFWDGPDTVHIGARHLGISVSESRLCVHLGVSAPIPANASENVGPIFE